jgi:hypothetical protein
LYTLKLLVLHESMFDEFEVFRGLRKPLPEIVFRFQDTFDFPQDLFAYRISRQELIAVHCDVYGKLSDLVYQEEHFDKIGIQRACIGDMA